MRYVVMSLLPDDDALIVPTADAEATLVEVGAGEVRLKGPAGSSTTRALGANSAPPCSAAAV